MVDLAEYRSHPEKTLLKHTHTVLENVKSATTQKTAEIAAIFHDVGKINPNFQRKLDIRKLGGYSNHAYLSAYSFLCYCAANQKIILDIFNNEREWLASILAIVAHHHGNLPNFPIIFKEEEYLRLLSFLDKKPVLPVSAFLSEFFSHSKFLVLEHKLKDDYLIRIPQRLISEISNPLDYFLETQFAFASVVAADKLDAGNYQKNDGAIKDFCSEYNPRIDSYLKGFLNHLAIDKARTKIRKEAISKIKPYLADGTRVFSLTSPTGSGKTLMLLSLAGEILKHENNLRIIYALPFLSITEQVEDVCAKVFKDLNDFVYRVDSKTENINFEKYQNELDGNPDIVDNLLNQQFIEDTFDYPFIITTFVRLFETLVSNRNATLLKLPNFSNAIFLIDEIQSLPPRLYGFFVALISAFCKKFNSYAIISTATMPNFELPLNNKHNLGKFFSNYATPPELVELKYFNSKIFNRYDIKRIVKSISYCNLADLVEGERESVLIILNTIKDTKKLFGELKKRQDEATILLLNTHFTPNDRKRKIKQCKEMLKNGHQVILISTQLIEAGVDIDFPVAYRDFAPIPNIVQSAGRCNRNGGYKQKGRLVLFDLKENERSRSNLIYRGRDQKFLNFAKENIGEAIIPEPKLLDLQKSFFNDVQEKTLFGLHHGRNWDNDEIDFVQQMEKVAFAEIGKFRLIDEQFFGKEYRYYVCKDPKNCAFERLEQLSADLRKIDFKDFKNRKLKFIEIENQLKSMGGQIVQIRAINNNLPTPSSDECFGLFKLSKEYYDEINGINLSSANQLI